MYYNILRNKSTKKNCARSWLYLQEQRVFSDSALTQRDFHPD